MQKFMRNTSENKRQHFKINYTIYYALLCGS